MSDRPPERTRRFLSSVSEGTRERLEAVGAPIDEVAEASAVLERCFRGGGKLLVFGNGGSAADAQHMATELVGRFLLERDGLPAIALTTDTSALTAIGNDYGFDRIFARQLEALGRRGDVALGISTSGSSPNVVAGIEAARERGLRTIALTGPSGGELAARADVVVGVAAAAAPRIQEGHLAIEHALCESVEVLLARQPAADYEASSGRVLAWDDLLALRARWRRQGRTVVWTNGCFDLMHAGHVQSLEAARQLGDVLVVGVNSDDSVRELKGPERPFVTADERAAVLAALRAVDAVTVFDDVSPVSALAELQPEVHCKGADYAPPGGKPIPELPIVESYGGRVEFLPLMPSRSSTDLITRIRHGDPAHAGH